MSIHWTKTKAGAAGEGRTKHCTYRFVIEPSEVGLHPFGVSSVITNTATGEVISEGHLGSASTVAACKRTAAWSIKTGGPRLDASIDGGAA